MTLWCCDRCGLVYANMDRVRAVSDGDGPVYYCIATNRDDTLGCGGWIRELGNVSGQFAIEGVP